MIQVEYHRYELLPRSSLNASATSGARTGCLLRVTFPDRRVGFADLFPWPEFGDRSLEDELTRLSKGQISALAEQSLALARIDADLRANGENAVAKYGQTKNHFLISDLEKISPDGIKQVVRDGFDTIKLKVGRNVVREAEWLESLPHHSLKIRLDFNSQGAGGKFETLIQSFSPILKSRIEYVEDPFPFSIEDWHRAQNLVPIAIDRELDNVQLEKLEPSDCPFHIVVIKPARQDHRKILRQMNRLQFKVVVTSNMDHAVGIAHALRAAGEIRKFYPNSILQSGCISQFVYQPNKFFDAIQTKGSFVTEIPGLGIGFDDLLANIQWTSFEKKT